MWLIWILLSFTTSTHCQVHPPLSFACRTAKEPECDKVHFVPGHSLLGQGFDIVTMKQTRAHLLDLQQSSTEDNTCTVCYNPYMNKTWQKLPHAILDWRPQSYCSRKINSEIFLSSTSLAEESGSEVKNNCFHLSDLPRLNKDLSRALKSLPLTYDASTKAHYKLLISIYGTHYISQADVGGQVLEVNAIKTCQISMDGISIDKLKDCLSLEASVAVTGKAEASAKATECKELSQKFNKGGSFHQTFNETSWEVRGGKITSEQLSFDGKNGEGAASFETWMESLKTDPDIVTYSLEPIHNLVQFSRPQREGLQKAINDYIREKALTKNCSCPSGSQLIPGIECKCFCLGSSIKNINCCPFKKGFAKVVVTVQGASNLWGDYTSKTDAFVKLSVGLVSAQTHTILNNDNPNWRSRFDLGILELSLVSNLKVEVWDEDNIYDDLLGTCQKPVNNGVKDEVCYLQYGSVTFTVSAQCLPHLTGPLCTGYAASTAMTCIP